MEDFWENLVKCPNYSICESILPEEILHCHSGTCANCNMKYGKWKSHEGKGNLLNFVDNVECPICLEIGPGVQQVFCEHSLCIKCFKSLYEIDYTENFPDEPTFPYLEVKDEYYGDQDNPKWEKEYPLIMKFNEEWNKWDDSRLLYHEDMCEKEAYRSLCPVCRSPAVN